MQNFKTSGNKGVGKCPLYLKPSANKEKKKPYNIQLAIKKPYCALILVLNRQCVKPAYYPYSGLTINLADTD